MQKRQCTKGTSGSIFIKQDGTPSGCEEGTGGIAAVHATPSTPVRRRVTTHSSAKRNTTPSLAVGSFVARSHRCEGGPSCRAGDAPRFSKRYAAVALQLVGLEQREAVAADQGLLGGVPRRQQEALLLSALLPCLSHSRLLQAGASS